MMHARGEREVKQSRLLGLVFSATLLVGTLAIVLGVASSAQARETAVSIILPLHDAIVRGTTQIVLKVSSETQWADVYIDGDYLSSGPPYIIPWSSAGLHNGPHTITAMAFRSAAPNSTLASTSSASIQMLGSQHVKIKVRGHSLCHTHASCHPHSGPTSDSDAAAHGDPDSGTYAHACANSDSDTAVHGDPGTYAHSCWHAGPYADCYANFYCDADPKTYVHSSRHGVSYADGYANFYSDTDPFRTAHAGAASQSAKSG